MTDLPDDGVWKLPDEFSDSELIEALETLWKDTSRRQQLGKRAREIILTRHAPRTCAEKYTEAIEQFYARSQRDSLSLVKAIANLEYDSPNDPECLDLARLISHTLPMDNPTRQLLVDVSATSQNDLKTGIQRVVRALVRELVQMPPAGYRVEPVYLTNQGQRWHYRYAREWTSSALDMQVGWLPDEPVEYSPGDIMLVADFTGGLAVEASRAGVFKGLKGDGIGLFFIVYDLLPIQMPDVFPPGQFGYKEWLNVVSSVANGAICISSAVAEDLRSWVDVSCPQRLCPIKIGWFHLGADIENSIPTRGLPKDAGQTLAQLCARPNFLMVGTIEPRKGYLQTLEAFSQLWQEGLDINLVIVGNEGWKSLPDDMRRTIPKIVKRLRDHPELGKRLFWLEGISDEYLERIYQTATCLIVASEGEGYGLPLIEAAQNKIPILARDIQVFREVAGEHAFYFSGLASEDLANAITRWLELYQQGAYPKSDDMHYLTWRESALQLQEQLTLSLDHLRINCNNQTQLKSY
jgi:glycosyltransferase involved in cell wall biosynthesis